MLLLLLILLFFLINLNTKETFDQHYGIPFAGFLYHNYIPYLNWTNKRYPFGHYSLEGKFYPIRY